MIEIDNCMHIKLINGEQICTICFSGYELVNNKCEKIKNTINLVIEGCSSYYYGLDNTKYCLKCNPSYIEVNYFCYNQIILF